MILLFTDFGLEGPYTGQVKAALLQQAPGVPVIDLFADAPSQRPYESAYLLAAYCQAFPEGSIFLCVVDPGVGGTRAAVALHADGRWFVGPDNGLLEIVRRHARTCQAFGIVPSRQPVSASFHGRDVFAPAVAALARGMTPQQAGWLPQNLTPRPDWPDDYSGIIYIDCYGNAMTGLRAEQWPENAGLRLSGKDIRRVRTFSDVGLGQPLCYANANGLIEVAVNQGRADRTLRLAVGTTIEIIHS